MKNITFAFVLSIFTIEIYGQSQKLEFFEIKIDSQWIVPESGTPPISLNESGNFDWIVISNMSYPTHARRMGIEGNALVEIQISKEGKTTKSTLVDHIEADTDKELLNLIPKLPVTWIPAKVSGQSVDSKILILFNFDLMDSDFIETSYKIYKCYKIRALSVTETSITKADHLVTIKEKKVKTKKTRKTKN